MFVQLRLKEKCVINQDTNSFMQSKARIKGDGGGNLQRMSRAKEDQVFYEAPATLWTSKCLLPFCRFHQHNIIRFYTRQCNMGS